MDLVNRLRDMTRGRKPTTSELRVMLEILLNQDRAVFASEIASNVDIGNERVRQVCQKLDEEGYIETNAVSGRNLYRLTDKGIERLASDLRESID